MGYKNIMIANPIGICIKNQQLVLGKGEEDYKIPLEDINSILIENLTIMVSAYFLQSMSEHGIVVYICDEKHMPNGVILPFVRHSRHLKMLNYQINCAKPLQKRLWQQIVIRKIENQANCLKLLEKEGFDTLLQMSRQVQSGDKTNVEAKAAAFYFRRLFDDSFYRKQENRINACLNYGYAIIRGIIARSIICYGFEPSLGLFHHSELNQFNLADDLIEPFRALVDCYVASNQNVKEIGTGITTEIKKELYNLINMDMKVKGENQSVNNCVEKLVMSLSSCLSEKNEQLNLPELIPMQIHQYE